MAVDMAMLLQGATVLVTGGVAWGGVRSALNGTRERIKSIDAKLDEHIKSDGTVQTTLLEAAARIETKLEERTTTVPKRVKRK